MDSEHNAPRQTFFPWFSMDSLKNKNKTLTHGGVSYTRYDRDIIYDGVTILSYKESVTDYGAWSSNLYGIAYVSIVPL